jgi:hypothetical protein
MISTPVSNLKRRLMATFAALTVCANGVLAAEMADDAQTQARRLIIHTSSAGITPADNVAVAGNRRSNSEAPSDRNHSGNNDAQEMARRMLTGQGAL